MSTVPGMRGETDPKEAVSAFLSRRGCSAKIVAGGLRGLVAEWERVLGDLTGGYPADTLDDYLNDMDVRELIHDTLAAVPAAREAWVSLRLGTADGRVRALLVPARGCLWGTINARKHGWSNKTNWWYFMQPAHPGVGLTKDLESWSDDD